MWSKVDWRLVRMGLHDMLPRDIEGSTIIPSFHGDFRNVHDDTSLAQVLF
jgi:hypothetical protein